MQSKDNTVVLNSKEPSFYLSRSIVKKSIADKADYVDEKTKIKKKSSMMIMLADKSLNSVIHSHFYFKVTSASSKTRLTFLAISNEREITPIFAEIYFP